jgi:TP901 family phage tail tape measure protein
VPFSATRDLWLVLKARDEASRAMGSFSRDIRMVGDSVRLANLQASRSALQNQMAVQRLTGASQADILVTQRKIETIDKEIGQMKVARASMEEQRVSAQKLSSVLQGAAGIATAFGTGMVAAGIFGAIGLKSLVNAAVEYQKQSQLTATQVDKFALSLQDVEKIGLRVANNIGVPFEQIQPALFNIFSSMEVGAADAEKLLTIFAKAAVAGQTDIQSASTATIGILNAFHLPLSDINHLMDVQFQLVKEGIGTYEEWTARIGLVTPSAVRAGQSVDMMAAALAASTRMGISAAQSGTAVARAMDAMSNPAAVNALKALGVNAVDASGNFRPMIDVLKDFRTKLEGLPEVEKVKKILDVFKGAGGTIQARRFLQNMLLTPGNLELFQQIFETMSTTSGSFEQAYAAMASTTATKSELIANKWQEVKIAAGTALIPTFNKVLDFVGRLFDWFNKLTPQQQHFIMKLLAFAAAASVAGGILLLLVGTLAAFAAAFVTAGSGLLVVLGALAGVGIALAAFTAAIVIAWKKSQGFRDIINEVSNVVRNLWQNVLIPFIMDVKASFDKYLLPAFRKLRDVVENDVLPALKELQQRWDNDILPAAKQVANFVKDRLADAFKFAGWVITTKIIPAIKWLTKYYKEHKQTIDQVIGVLVWLGKWLLIIAAVVTGFLLVAFGGPIIGIFLAFGLALTAIGIAIIWVIERVKEIVSWFKHFGAHMDWLKNKSNSVWKDIKDFFIGIWNSILDFFKNVWETIVGVFNAAMDILKTGWNNFWKSDIGGLLIAIWNLIVAVVQLALTTIELGFAWFIEVVKAMWEAFWTGIKADTEAAWNFIFPFLKGVWEGIVAVAKIVWDVINLYFSALWAGTQAIFGGFWIAIRNYVVGIWNDIVNNAKVIWGAFTAVISSAIQNAKNYIMGTWQGIKDVFNGAKDFLFGAGANLIQGLIDGITSKVDAVTEKVKAITEKLKGFFPHSPAKWGPLAGKGGMFYAGQTMVNQLSDGIQSKIGLVNSGSSMLASAAGMGAQNVAAANSSSINQNITINTQELNPKRQAAELGWLLAGSI